MSEIYDWQGEARATRIGLLTDARYAWLGSRLFLTSAALSTAFEGLNAPLRWGDIVTPLLCGLASIHFSDRANLFERLAELGPSAETPVELDGLQVKRV